MLNITDLKAEEKKPPLFRLAFRPFFLFSCVFSVIALILWGGHLSGTLQAIEPYGGWFWWHGHEMLFGFVCAIIVGFLLTAVQNWSGTPGLSGWPLAGLFLVWLLGRLFIALPVIPALLIAIIDVLFLPLAAFALARPVIATKLWRNMIFVPLLLLLAWTNYKTHSVLLNGNAFALLHTQSTILIITVIMAVLGGRVIPFFTANATRTPKPKPIKIIEVLAIGGLVAPLLFNLIIKDIAPNTIIGLFYLVAAIANLIRFSRWQFQLTFDNPLLWSLHLAYLFVCISLVMLAAYHFGLNMPLTTALHGLTVGAMGLLILAMISRVSLGHTGRMLIVGKWISGGYIALAVAAITRLLAPFITDNTTELHLISIAAWVLGYSAFVVIYWPVLTQPRVDGRPG